MLEKQLHDVFDDSIVAQKILDSRVLNKVIEATVEKAISTLCYQVDLSHTPSVIRLVERIRWLKYEYKNALTSMISEGELAFEDLKENEALRKSDAETG